jgi:hypothetical protein
MLWAEEAERPSKKGRTIDAREPELPKPPTKTPDTQPIDALKVGVAYRLYMCRCGLCVSTFILHVAIGLRCQLCSKSIFPASSPEAEYKPGRLSVA